MRPSQGHQSRPVQNDLDANEIQDFLTPFQQDGRSENNIYQRVALNIAPRSLADVQEQHLYNYTVPREFRNRQPRNQRRTSSSGASTTSQSIFDDEQEQESDRTTIPSTAPSRRPHFPQALRAMIDRHTLYHAPHTLPCEFAGYADCDASFPADDFEGWFAHILTGHLRNKIPPSSVCWFCDDFDFHAGQNGRSPDWGTNFQDRMQHIREHMVNDGYMIHDMRPDFFLLEHMEEYRLIDPEKISLARQWVDGPAPFRPDIYNHDFMPEATRRRERLDTVQVIDQRSEDRRRRREGRRHHS